jgi:hypothetical protein
MRRSVFDIILNARRNPRHDENEAVGFVIDNVVIDTNILNDEVYCSPIDFIEDVFDEQVL